MEIQDQSRDVINMMDKTLCVRYESIFFLEPKHPLYSQEIKLFFISLSNIATKWRNLQNKSMF